VLTLILIIVLVVLLSRRRRLLLACAVRGTQWKRILRGAVAGALATAR